jgi:hypothetical protein
VRAELLVERSRVEALFPDRPLPLRQCVHARSMTQGDNYINARQMLSFMMMVACFDCLMWRRLVVFGFMSEKLRFENRCGSE